MKILLVDDEQAMLDIIGHVLQKQGYEILTAMTGNEALAKIASEKPNLIFLDQILPDMNGNQVLEAIKKDPTTKQIPVAILSNYNQQELVDKAIAMGAADYIFKYQIDPQDISQKVKQMLDESNAAQTQPPKV